MNPGDKVWFFNGQEILSIIVEGIEPDAVYGYNKVQIKTGSEAELLHYRVEMPYPVFPTREALCKHYRKIFE